MAEINIYRVQTFLESLFQKYLQSTILRVASAFKKGLHPVQIWTIFRLSFDQFLALRSLLKVVIL